MGSRSALLHLICRTPAAKDQTGPPGQSWPLNRIRTQSMYLGPYYRVGTSVSDPTMSALGEGETEGRRQGSRSDEGRLHQTAAGRVATQIGCDQSEPWPKGTLMWMWEWIWMWI